MFFWSASLAILGMFKFWVNSSNENRLFRISCLLAEWHPPWNVCKYSYIEHGYQPEKKEKSQWQLTDSLTPKSINTKFGVCSLNSYHKYQIYNTIQTKKAYPIRNNFSFSWNMILNFLFKFLRDFGSPMFSTVILYYKYWNFGGFINPLPYSKYENYVSVVHILKWNQQMVRKWEMSKI